MQLIQLDSCCGSRRQQGACRDSIAEEYRYDGLTDGVEPRG